MQSIVSAGGYFTLLKYLFDKPTATLENQLGFSTGSLTDGWQLLMPRYSVTQDNIDLRGSTRWSDGAMPDGRLISSVIASRTDLTEAQRKVATFFQSSPDNKPAKVVPNNKPLSYPSAKPVGIPQFKLVSAIEWSVVADVRPGELLPRQRFRWI